MYIYIYIYVFIYSLKLPCIHNLSVMVNYVQCHSVVGGWMLCFMSLSKESRTCHET